MATAAGVLLLGPVRRRVAAYSLIVIAGLLKIHPLVLLVLTLRERPRVFLWVNVAAATVVLATSIFFHAELVKMVANIPGGGFGAHILPDFIVWMAGISAHPRLAGLVELSTYAALFLAIVGWFSHMYAGATSASPWYDCQTQKRYFF
jgi:hypothetical protein